MAHMPSMPGFTAWREKQKWDPAETRYISTEMTITNRKVMKTYLAIYI
jgi:hypothetical protein